MSLKILGNGSSNVHFESRAKKDAYADPRAVATSFVNMSDGQLRALAYSTAVTQNQEKKSRKSFMASLYAIPVAAVAADGILAAKGGLSQSIKTMGKSGAKWAGALGLLGLYNAAKSGLASKSQGFKDFERGNPGASLVLDLGVFASLLAVGYRAYDKVKVKVLDKIINKHPEKLAKAISQKDKFFSKVDSSFVNKNLLENAKKGVNKLNKVAPWAVSAGKFGLRNIVWVVLAGGMLSAASQAKKTREKIESNYNQLKDAQFETAQKLVNVFGVERDVLAQESSVSDELKEQMDKTL